MEIYDPGNDYKIEKVWMFISQDENGNEGIIGMNNFPFVCTNEGLKDKILSMISDFKKNLDKRYKIKLICFDNRLSEEEL